MIKFGKYQLIIFDFHKTLTDSVYFNHLDPDLREMISNLVFRPPNNELWDRPWMTGKITYKEVLRYLSEQTEIEFDRLEEELYAGLLEMKWNQKIWDFSQSVRTFSRTAIASINTDLFSSFIVPRFNLASRFDAVVNSYDLGEISKTRICIFAARKLGLDLRDNRILLIDDKQENIDEFVTAGGEGYLYQDDETFQDWLEGQC